MELTRIEVEEFYMGRRNGAFYEGSVSPIYAIESRRPHTLLSSTAKSVCSDASAGVDVVSKIGHNDAYAVGTRSGTEVSVNGKIDHNGSSTIGTGSYNNLNVNGKTDHDNSYAIVFEEAPVAMKKKERRCWNSEEHNRRRCREKKILFCNLCGEKGINKYVCLNPECVATRRNDLGSDRKS